MTITTTFTCSNCHRELAAGKSVHLCVVREFGTVHREYVGMFDTDIITRGTNARTVEAALDDYVLDLYTHGVIDSLVTAAALPLDPIDESGPEQDDAGDDEFARCRNCDGAHHVQACREILDALMDNTAPIEIELANDRGVVLVDKADYPIVSRFSWHLHSQGYAAAKIGGAQVYMHHFIIKAPTGQVIDHINRNKLDNRRSNLRPVFIRQNAQNSKHRDGTLSQYRGVTRDTKRNTKWQASIRIDGKKTHLGTFESEIDAARAYDTAAREHHGEFAQLNFPDGAALRAPVELAVA